MWRLVLGAALLMLAENTSSQEYGNARLSLREELRLDANREDFSVVTNINVGPRGHIVVPLRQDLQVRIYDPTGRRIATVGRPGSGPGEFRSLTSFGWIGDTLWIFDGAQTRTTFVALDGRILRTSLLPTLSGSSGNSPAYLGFSPVSYLSDQSLVGMARRVESSGNHQESRLLVRHSPVVATRILAALPSEHDDRWFMTVGSSSKPLPFATRPQIVVSPYGNRMAFLTVSTPNEDGEGHIAVTSLSLSGDTLFNVSLPFRGVPLPARQVDSALAALAPPKGGMLEGPDLTAEFQTIAKRRMPKVYPPVQRLTVGADQTVWITLRDDAKGRHVVGLNEKGQPVGTLLLSPTSRLEQATSSHIWVTETDADGLVSIVRYRVIGWPGS